MNNAKLSGREYLLLVAVISMYFFAPTQGIISSVLSQIGETYTDVSAAGLTYLVSINNLFAVFSALLFSILAGRKLSYKAIGIIALVLFVAGGGVPMFLPDTAPYWLLLATRAIMGLGRGCFVPIIQAVFVDMFHDEARRSAMFGIGSIFFNIGATTGTTIAGALGLINWHMCFMFYLFAIIPLALFSIFFREPRATQEFKKQKIHLPAIAWLFFALYLSATIASQMLWNYASQVMGSMGINSLEVGTVLSTFTVAAMIVAAVFVIIFKVFNTFSCAVGLAAEGLGFIVMFVGTAHPEMGLACFYIGSFLIGFGANAVTLGVPMIMSVTVPAAAVTAALGLSEVFHNLGAFLSSPFSQVMFAIGGPQMSTNDIFVATAVFAFVMAALAMWVGVRARGAKRRRAKDDAEAAERYAESETE